MLQILLKTLFLDKNYFLNNNFFFLYSNCIINYDNRRVNETGNNTGTKQVEQIFLHTMMLRNRHTPPFSGPMNTASYNFSLSNVKPVKADAHGGQD